MALSIASRKSFKAESTERWPIISAPSSLSRDWQTAMLRATLMILNGRCSATLSSPGCVHISKDPGANATQQPIGHHFRPSGFAVSVGSICTTMMYSYVVLAFALVPLSAALLRQGFSHTSCEEPGEYMSA
jgi:hypothetical protein